MVAAERANDYCSHRTHTNTQTLVGVTRKTNSDYRDPEPRVNVREWHASLLACFPPSGSLHIGAHARLNKLVPLAETHAHCYRHHYVLVHYIYV